MLNGTLAHSAIEKRVNSAKQDAIHYFIKSNSRFDFYFEDLLNCFIALAQYPINFAIFSESGGVVKLGLRLCADKKHE